jgi:hypothetical protein
MADLMNRIEEAARAMWIEWGGTKETWEVLAKPVLPGAKDNIAELYKRGARACEAVLREEPLRKAARELVNAMKGFPEDPNPFTYRLARRRARDAAGVVEAALSSPLHQAEPAVNYVSEAQPIATFKCQSCGSQQWPMCPTCGAMMLKAAPSGVVEREDVIELACQAFMKTGGNDLTKCMTAAAKVICDARDQQWRELILLGLAPKDAVK